MYIRGQVKRSREKKGPVKRPRAVLGQSQAVKNLDPGRGRSYGKYWSDRPLMLQLRNAWGVVNFYDIYTRTYIQFSYIYTVP